jgi:hypothetical protein
MLGCCPSKENPCPATIERARRSYSEASFWMGPEAKNTNPAEMIRAHRAGQRGEERANTNMREILLIL